MIGTQPTGAIEGVVISAVAHEGLRVTVDGKPARLAVIDDDGNVISSGRLVAREAEAVALNSYRNFLQGKGHLRVLGNPLEVTRG
jgi:hypothetical protein